MLQPPPGDRWLPIKKLAQRLGESEDTVRRRLTRGEIGPGTWITPTRRAWLESEIAAYLARLQAKSDAKNAERASVASATPAPVGHLEVTYAAADRAAVAVRRLDRFGFKAIAVDRGEQHVVEIALERGDIAHTLDMLKCCVGDVVRSNPPVFVEHQPGAVQ